MIEVSNLIKKYSGKTALDGISFKASQGEILGLLGPNGAGKSTTMNIITGYISATQGTVTVDGFEISRDPASVKKKIGYLPEIPPLYPDMTVEGYLKFVCGLKGIKRDRKQHVDDIVEKTKLTEVKRRLIKNLSKGYMQRVGIAQALVGNPELLIFDEPTVGLDPAQMIETRELIKQLGKEHTVILSSHILSEISAVCDRVIVLNKGKIAADLKTNELSAAFSNNQKLKLEVEGASDKVVAVLKSIKGISEVKDDGSVGDNVRAYTVEYNAKDSVKREIFKALASADCPILKMDKEGHSLEQLFLQLTSDESGKNTKGGKKK